MFGSLDAIGCVHGTPKAVVRGLEGEEPAETGSADQRLAEIGDRR